MKKVIVLGGSGFVGAYVCRQLANHGWQVTLATRRLANAGALKQQPNLSLLELNPGNAAALLKGVAGHQALVNLVAILHGSPSAFAQAHVAVPTNIARACLLGGVAQVLHFSALGANAAQPEQLPSNYLRTKSQGEQILIAASQGQLPAGLQTNPAATAGGGFDLSILRPSVIFGAGDKFLNVFAKLQKNLPLLPLAGAGALLQPVWAQDLASAVLRCLEGASSTPSPRIIEAVGPQVFTLKQLVQLAGRLTGAARPILALPNWAAHLQVALISLVPGEPIFSRDNLAMLKIPNIASGQLPDLSSLGIDVAALEPIAQSYLRPTAGH